MSDLDTESSDDGATPAAEKPLAETELDSIAGGAFDGYMNFPPAGNPPPPKG